MQYHWKPQNNVLQQTLVSDRYPSQRSLGLKMNKSLESLSLPFQCPTRLKFLKDRTFRKQTSMTMLIETQEPSPRPSVKINYESNNSTIFEVYPEHHGFRKTRAAGMFHSLSLQSRPASVQNRSIEDFGAYKNRKKQTVFRQIKNDPILIGDSNGHQKFSKKVAKEPQRAYRDQGQRMKNYFVWDKTKPKSYLERYKAAKNIK